MGTYSGKISWYEDFPEELFVEIFIRSSVKSLARVKCVCKLWYALINSPSFTKKHLEYQKMMSTKDGIFLLRHYHRDNDKASYFLFDEESIANSVTSSSSYNVFVHPSLFASICSGPITRIEGPVNGLYCVYNGSDRFVIWNPATSEVGFLPLAEDFLCGMLEGDEESFSLYCIIGFGTDPSNEDDYKVLAICKYDDGSYADDYCRILYTASTNTWRFLKDDGFVGSGNPSSYRSNNTYLKGVYYWLTSSVHAGSRYILAFDMGREAFHTISTTNIIYSEDSDRCYDIALHKDQIALFIVNNVKKDTCEIDIWVLNDDIWIKEMSVDTGLRGIEKSLGFWKDDDELLLLVIDDSEGQTGDRANSQTVLYNTTSRVIVKNIGPRGCTNVFEATFYHESLVSLSGEIMKYKGNYASVLEVVALFLIGAD